MSVRRPDKARLLIAVASPFSRRDYERFGVAYLRQCFAVTVADLTAWKNPHVWAANYSLQYREAGVATLSSRSQFAGLVREWRPEFVVDYAGFDRSTCQNLVAAGARRIVYQLGLLPQIERRTLWRKIVDTKFYSQRRTAFLRYFQAVWLQRVMRPTPPPDIVIAPGRATKAYFDVGKSHFIWAHSLDYDLYLGVRAKPALAEAPYAVYLDEDPAFHSDFLHLGLKPLVTPEKYYPALLNFFSRFELETGLKVRIAAHPRARWSSRLHLLGGRVPEFGRTAELVRSSRMVFAHASTSLSFAVLWHRPIVLLSTDELQDSLYKYELRLRSRLFRRPIYNIDACRAEHIQEMLSASVDLAAYHSYRQDYIKLDDTPDRPVWEIVAAALEPLRP